MIRTIQSSNGLGVPIPNMMHLSVFFLVAALARAPSGIGIGIGLTESAGQAGCRRWTTFLSLVTTYRASFGIHLMKDVNRCEVGGGLREVSMTRVGGRKEQVELSLVAPLKVM